MFIETSLWQIHCGEKLKLSIGRRKHKLIKHQQHDVDEKFSTLVAKFYSCRNVLDMTANFYFSNLKCFIQSIKIGNEYFREVHRHDVASLEVEQTTY